MTTHDEIYDKRHADMIKRFAEYYKSKGHVIHATEVPYHFPGGREGYVDVVMSKEDTLFLCELKPFIYDIGQALREVNGAEHYFLKARPEFNKFKKVICTLELEPTQDNFEIIFEHIEQFRLIQVRFFEGDHPSYPSYTSRWQNILIGDYSLERSNGFYVLGYLCIMCSHRIERETPLCDKCADIMKLWYPPLIRVANTIQTQFMKVNSEFLEKDTK